MCSHTTIALSDAAVSVLCLAYTKMYNVLKRIWPRMVKTRLVMNFSSKNQSEKWYYTFTLAYRGRTQKVRIFIMTGGGHIYLPFTIPFTVFCGLIGLTAFCRSVHQWQEMTDLGGSSTENINSFQCLCTVCRRPLKLFTDWWYYWFGNYVISWGVAGKHISDFHIQVPIDKNIMRYPPTPFCKGVHMPGTALGCLFEILYGVCIP